MAGPFRLPEYGWLGATGATAPAISTLTPADNSIGIDPSANLVIVFTLAVDAKAGADNDIRIYRSSDDALIESIDAQSGQVTGSGTDTITVNPTADLANGIAYYVQIGADAFDGTVGGLSFPGFADKTTWNFETGSFSDTYMVVSTIFPDALDVYVDGILVARYTS